MRRSGSLIFCACLWATTTAQAADRADLEGTQITGSRELPKVLYIVPWKQPLPTDLVGRPAQSLLDEALAPLDREVFRREVQYHALMQDVSALPAAAAPESKAQ